MQARTKIGECNTYIHASNFHARTFRICVYGDKSRVDSAKFHLANKSASVNEAKNRQSLPRALRGKFLSEIRRCGYNCSVEPPRFCLNTTYTLPIIFSTNLILQSRFHNRLVNRTHRDVEPDIHTVSFFVAE